MITMDEIICTVWHTAWIATIEETRWSLTVYINNSFVAGLIKWVAEDLRYYLIGTHFTIVVAFKINVCKNCFLE